MSILQTYRRMKTEYWLVLLVFWMFIALFITSQLYFNSIKNGLDPSWTSLFLGQLPIWVSWGLVSPALLYAVNKYPFDLERWMYSLLIYLGLGMVVLFLMTNLTLIYMFSVYGYLDLTNASLADYTPYFLSRLTNDFMIYVFVVMIIVLVRSYTLKKNDELNIALVRLKNDQLKNQLTQSQLQALKLQLNPHFLFNTLNTISTLTLIGENTNSIDVTTKLGDFLRRTLDYEEHQLVSLAKELEFFDLYLEIESVRFKDRMDLRRYIDPACHSHKVPNLILQPLIENAIKYGIAKTRNARLIELSVEERNGNLCIELFNEGPQLSREVAGNGIGLNNIRRRLEKLYDKNYLFEISNDTTRNGVRALIHIPVVINEANHAEKPVD